MSDGGNHGPNSSESRQEVAESLRSVLEMKGIPGCRLGDVVEESAYSKQTVNDRLAELADDPETSVRVGETAGTGLYWIAGGSTAETKREPEPDSDVEWRPVTGSKYGRGWTVLWAAEDDAGEWVFRETWVDEAEFVEQAFETSNPVADIKGGRDV